MKVLLLLKQHTHNGVKYRPGATLPPLDDRVATWLIAQDVGEEVKNPSNRTPSPPVRRASCCGGKW